MWSGISKFLLGCTAITGTVGVGKVYLPQLLGYVHIVQATTDKSGPGNTKGITIPDWLFRKYKVKKGIKVTLKKGKDSVCLQAEESKEQNQDQIEVKWALNEELKDKLDFSDWKECSQSDSNL
ncbi:hypothetical protein MHLP_02520 [Candidatus Mycoplasma haematolamae str. Purdue]|uniref:Uncharacterized protein n=1 Tax=Mycoplasma haematolamae (strain Purdue) TaxID=1212765 RepID=I7CJP7_MYCHA|nr:hypothetical protein [Candidatus Mycoplasma haematolamae]AFO52084.1 hypothetical protein MHLP_02520 [Candidatus Mycoplasma haematolamae str. Purdue]